jgi:hypothetical protein
MSAGAGVAKCLVVIERGATCPAFVADMRSECLLHERRAGEGVDELEQRVDTSLRALGSNDWLALAVFVCSDTAAGAAAARSRSAISVADAQARSGQGELLLMAGPDVDDELRQELFGLAERLCERVVGTGVGVRLRFDELQSGIMSTAPMVAADRTGSGSA